MQIKVIGGIGNTKPLALMSAKLRSVQQMRKEETRASCLCGLGV